MIMRIREFLKKSLKNNEKGFTLIELLVVVVILGSIASVVIPRIYGSADNAAANADKANLQMIQSAIETYRYEEGSNPADLDDLEPKYLNDVPVPLDTTKEFKYDSADGVVTIGNKS